MPLPDGLEREDVDLAYCKALANVVCGNKTGVPCKPSRVESCRQRMSKIIYHRVAAWRTLVVLASQDNRGLLCELFLRLSGHLRCVRLRASCRYPGCVRYRMLCMEDVLRPNSVFL